MRSLKGPLARCKIPQSFHHNGLLPTLQSEFLLDEQRTSSCRSRSRHQEECTMRSIALSVFAFALIACSSDGTGQTTAAAVAGGGNPTASQHGNGNGNGKGGGGAGGGAVSSGCTYTQGFWKTHPSAWPVKSLTIGGVSYTEQQLLDLFNTPPMGDASLILVHQLIAALLNTANNAAPSAAVNQAINDAQAWMAANRGDAGLLPYGVPAGSAAGQQATALTQSLDNFNSGMAGTAHCGGGSSSGGGGSSGSSSGSSSGCADGVTPCPTGTSSVCAEGMACVEGCCVPTPPTTPPDSGPTL